MENKEKESVGRMGFLEKNYVVSMWYLCGKIYSISINIFESAFF